MDEEFLRRHRPGEGETIVDLGCGTGEFTAVLAQAAPEGAVTGIDADASMLAAARRHRAPNLSFQQADAAEVDTVVAAASVDLVVSRAMLHWLPAQRHPQLYRAVRQILRPGGVFHLEAGAPGNIREIIGLMDELAARHGIPAPPPFPEPGRALELLEQAGFEVDSDGVRTRAVRRNFTRDQLAGLLSSQVALVLTRHVDPERARAITAEAIGAVDRLRRHDGSYDQTFVRLEILVRRPAAT